MFVVCWLTQFITLYVRLTAEVGRKSPAITTLGIEVNDSLLTLDGVFETIHNVSASQLRSRNVVNRFKNTIQSE